MIMRTGVIAKKMGMTRLFQDDGRHVPVTVLALENVQVVAAAKPTATAMSPSSSAPARPRRRTFPSRSAAISARPKVEPKARVAEFRVAEDALLDVGARSPPIISSPARWSTSRA
jgi:large subunit ribosomal protein L3